MSRVITVSAEGAERNGGSCAEYQKAVLMVYIELSRRPSIESWTNSVSQTITVFTIQLPLVIKCSPSSSSKGQRVGSIICNFLEKLKSVGLFDNKSIRLCKVYSVNLTPYAAVYFDVPTSTSFSVPFFETNLSLQSLERCVNCAFN